MESWHRKVLVLYAFMWSTKGAAEPQLRCERILQHQHACSRMVFSPESLISSDRHQLALEARTQGNS
jgi:hypothetical protein